jgi:glutamate N-acetyltransferase/amino-acid N-acetyltransferase
VAVNLEAPGPVASVPGVRLATANAGIKQTQRDDVALLHFAPGTTAAGVFTQSAFRAAPVTLAIDHLRTVNPRSFLINSGNANAATGAEGLADARMLCAAAARGLGVTTEEVLPFSTGVIGERLPVSRIEGAIDGLVEGLVEDGWPAAAGAIMTTDTVPKLVSTVAEVGGRQVTITGMAKGAGMIRPDMATMLAFVCTDAAVTKDCLAALVRRAADGSFNRITVDGDTSTNDAFMVAATGAAGNEPVEDAQSADAGALLEGILEVAVHLAQAIVRDGEGATKFVTVSVGGGRTEGESLQVAYTVAESPLVKTALFASDPNWGRLAMAIGRAGVENLDAAGVAVWFDDVQVMSGGVMDPGYTEAAGAEILAREEFTIRIDLGRGDAHAEVWTSDFSYDYVRINAEYRT